MNRNEESDPIVVATKPTNKAGRPVAEPVERRVGTEGNASQHNTRRAQNRESVTQALERVRQVARTAPVYSVVFGTIDGQPVVVSGSFDKTIRLWDARARKPIGPPLAGHTDYVTSVAFGAIDDSSVVISGSWDKTIRLWDARTLAPMGAPLQGHTAFVNAVAYGVIERRPVAISGSDDGTIRTWDMRAHLETPRKKQTRQFRPTSNAALAALGASDGREVVSLACDDGAFVH